MVDQHFQTLSETFPRIFVLSILLVHLVMMIVLLFLLSIRNGLQSILDEPTIIFFFFLAMATDDPTTRGVAVHPLIFAKSSPKLYDVVDF